MHSVVVNTHSTRLCAARFESALYKLLVVSVYLPCEGSSSEEFSEQLACIEGIIRIVTLYMYYAVISMLIFVGIGRTLTC